LRLGVVHASGVSQEADEIVFVAGLVFGVVVGIIVGAWLW
jgi:hypothetical protein